MIRSIFYQFFLLIVVNSVSAKLNVSSSCETRCGTVAIPYPFGIGDGCYHKEWYEVRCNKRLPFLPKINKEVVRIDIPRPIEYGRYESASMGCSDGEKSEELLNFTGTPFSMSHNNTLVAFGCNIKATLTHIEPRIVGCFSTCNSEKIPLTFSEKGCYGYECCNASIPEEGGQVIGVKIESSDGNRTRGGCEVAFLTDEYNQPSSPWGNKMNPKWFHARQYFTVELNWYVITTNTSFEESLNCGEDFHSGQSAPCYCKFLEISDGPTHLWLRG